ncbi:phosphatidylinositol 4-phosphate 5-kinase type-1 gamma-like [Salvelinus alpinus]|uniref:phosphatidylinositol 4-phosphate 5-kinase type-1 gamma-like n=1 Tax=Salvelinus alpinus TaxID=8036 RepID=UPI0039FC9CAB
MHYSKLLGIHNLEQVAREQAGEEAVGAADQRPPPSQGQKSLYCTAIEAIRGEAHGVRSERPDLLPKTPTHNDVTSNSGETTLQLIVGKLGAHYHGSSHQVSGKGGAQGSQHRAGR